MKMRPKHQYITELSNVITTTKLIRQSQARLSVGENEGDICFELYLLVLLKVIDKSIENLTCLETKLQLCNVCTVHGILDGRLSKQIKHELVSLMILAPIFTLCISYFGSFHIKKENLRLWITSFPILSIAYVPFIYTALYSSIIYNW